MDDFINAHLGIVIQKQERMRSGYYYWNIIGKIAQLCAKVYDPLITKKIGQKYLLMHLSHQLPYSIAANPYYDSILPRICSFLKENQGYLTMIEIGANIGDTVSLITDKTSGEFLLIEPSDKFFPLLLKNTLKIANTHCEKIIIDETVSFSDSRLVTYSGTARVSAEKTDSKGLDKISLDNFVEKFPAFLRTNMLKIDTDGYDYKVLRSAARLLDSAKPALFFELSPLHLSYYGEEPFSIFDFLSAKGYEKVLFYDNTGYPLIFIKTCDIEYIRQILNYSYIKGNIYFDVLAIHSAYNEQFNQFHKMELAFYPKYKRPELQNII